MMRLIISLTFSFFALALVACSNSAQNSTARQDTILAGSQTLATTRDTSLTITLQAGVHATLLADDTAAGGVILFSVTGQPANGILTGELSGVSPVMTYTPNKGFSGNDSFTYKAIDGNGGVATGTINITVLDTVDPLLDTDDDGLSDLEEINIYKTNPNITDSDGDSLSDWREVIDLAFNPDKDNYRFNPLIADVPRLKLELTSAPDIDLNYTDSTGSSQTISTERSSASSVSVSNSRTDSRSTSVERSYTEGMEVTATASLDPSVEVSASYSYTETTTEETSTSWTRSQTQENSQALSRGKALEQNRTITRSSGSLSMSVAVTNDGSLPFTLKSLTLSAIEVDRKGRIDNLIGNLNFDTSFLSFPEFTLVPGQRSGNMVFVSGELDLATAYGILEDTDGLIISAAASEIVDENGIAFAFNQTDIQSKTASVIIDYGPVRDSERYIVSTAGNADTLTISMKDILENVLRIPYQAGASSFSAVRDIVGSGANRSWLLIHTSFNSLGNITTIYDRTGVNPAGASSSVVYKVLNAQALQDIQVAAGDSIRLVFIDDEDGDKLGLRSEILNGTNPKLADTDGDLLNDKAEIDGWNVTVTDAGEMTLNYIGYGKTNYWPSAPATGFQTVSAEIDEVRFWNVARDATQISANRNVALASQSGLIGLWHMDAVSGTANDIAADSSGNGNDITLVNVSNATSGFVVDGNADIGSHFVLDGTDDILQLPDRLVSSQRTMTLEMRFRTIAGATGPLFSYNNPAANHYVPALYIGTDGKLRGKFWVGANAKVLVSDTAVNDDAWHHVALVYDDALEEQRLYVDGAIVGNAPLAGRVDHLGTTYSYAVTANPLLADADSDSLSDMAEYLLGSDPENPDTDGDWMTDNDDNNPLEAVNIRFSLKGTQPTAADPTTTVSWYIPDVPASLSDYRVVLLEQVVAASDLRGELASLPGINTMPAVGDTLACDNGSACWRVVHADTARPVSKTWYNYTSGNIGADRLEYIALLRVSGRWHKIPSDFAAYLGPIDRITIKFVNVQNHACLEGLKSSNFNFIFDQTCERAWQMLVDGNPVHVLPDANYVSAGAPVTLTYGLNGPASTYSFDRYALSGQCLTLSTRLAEVDGSQVLAKYDNHQICYDSGWGSGSGAPDYAGTYTYTTPVLVLKQNSSQYQNVSASATYEITITRQ